MSGLPSTSLPYYQTSIIPFYPTSISWQKSVNETNIAHQVRQETFRQLLPLWTANISENLKQIRKGRSILDIPKPTTTKALIVGAGPSVWFRGHLDFLAKESAKGNLGNTAIFATDRILGYLIWRNVKVDYVVSADGSPKIAEFYHRLFAKRSLEHYSYPPPVTLLNAGTIHNETLERVRDLGLSIAWYNHIWDSPNGHLTEFLISLTGKPAIPAGGDTGSTAWSLAATLGVRNIGLVGFDYSESPERPWESYSYWDTHLKDCGGDAEKAKERYKLVEYDTSEWGPVKAWVDAGWGVYREVTLQLLREVGVKYGVTTSNLTEGGVLVGEPLILARLEEWLKN